MIRSVGLLLLLLLLLFLLLVLLAVPSCQQGAPSPGGEKKGEWETMCQRRARHQRRRACREPDLVVMDAAWDDDMEDTDIADAIEHTDLMDSREEKMHAEEEAQREKIVEEELKEVAEAREKALKEGVDDAATVRGHGDPGAAGEQPAQQQQPPAGGEPSWWDEDEDEDEDAEQEGW